jgi:hypothetical protein
LLTGFFWVVEFVVEALNFETQPHCSAGEPHEIGPLHCPDFSSCTQSAVPAPAHLHTPPGQGRSAKVGVATKGAIKTIATRKICKRRISDTLYFKDVFRRGAWIPAG